MTTDMTNALRALVEAAYKQGAHDYAGQGWDSVDRDELADCAADYAATVDSDDFLAALATAQPEGVASGVVQVCPECDIHGCRHQRVTRQAQGGGEESP